MKLGISKLFPSGKFWFAMILFVPATVALFLKDLDSNSYALIVGTVGSIFLAAHSLSDVISQKLCNQQQGMSASTAPTPPAPPTT